MKRTKGKSPAVLLAAAAIMLAGARETNAQYYLRSSLDKTNTLVVSEEGDTTFDLTYNNLTNHAYRVVCGYSVSNDYAHVNMRLSNGMTGDDDYSIALAITEGNTRADTLKVGLVFKVTAPEKKYFSGGAMSMDTRHLGVYDLCTGSNSNWRAATFDDEPEYVWHTSLPYRTGLLDANALCRTWYTNSNNSGSYIYEKLTLNIPVGRPSFYVAIWNRAVRTSGLGAYSTIRLNAIELNNVNLGPPTGTMISIR